MQPTEYHISEQAALFRLPSRTEQELLGFLVQAHLVATLASVPENRRDTEALILACRAELARRGRP